MTKRAIRVSESDAANDFPSLLAHVRAGAEVVIERDAEPVAVLRPATPRVRLLSESLRLAKKRGQRPRWMTHSAKI
jgi:antitoxin (DNA-binding transcriptional repressor) of toxin-antitoxin stability system